MKRIHLIVTGVVQGVGFRHYTRREAEALKLTGFVQNKSDGTVEIEAQGTQEAIERFLEWAKHGPLHARVESVVQKELSLKEEKSFEIR